MPRRVTGTSSTAGRTTAAAARAAWTSHHETPWARATSEAALPDVITAETTCSRNLVVERAYRGTCSVDSQNVPLVQAGSRQNQRRLDHTAPIAPAIGTSRICWSRREWTFVASTPQDGQPGGKVEATTTRRSPSGRSMTSMTW